MDKSRVRKLKERASYDLSELFSFLNKTHFVTPELDKEHSADIDLANYLESL